MVVGLLALSLRSAAGPSPQQRRARALGDLLQGAGFRPFAGALAGEVPYVPFRRDVRIAAPIPAADGHGRGVLLLLRSRPAEAVETLLVHANDNAGADTWCDLAVAYLSLADSRDSGEAALDALVAANRALALQPDHIAARFNRAVALHRLGLGDEIAAELRLLNMTDRSGAWAREASTYARIAVGNPRESWEAALSEIRRTRDRASARALVAELPQEARAWGEGVALGEWADAILRRDDATASSVLDVACMLGEELQRESGESMLADTCNVIQATTRSGDRARIERLARSVRAYRDGRREHSLGRNAQAATLFATAVAELEACGVPLAEVARYYVGGSLFAQFRPHEALAVLEALSRRMERESGYRSLRAQIAWERGLSQLALGGLSDAVEIFREAQRTFESIGESQNAAVMSAFTASALEHLDDPDGAWLHRVQALRALAAAGNHGRRAASITAAADHRIRREEWPRARALLDVAARIAAKTKNAETSAYILTRRSLVRSRMNDPRGATHDLSKAATIVQTIADEGARERASANLDVAVASLAAHDGRSLELLSRAARYYERTAPPLLVPILLERARLHRRAGRPAASRQDLLDAIALLERNRTNVRDLSQRAAMFTAAKPVFDEAIAGALAAADVGEVFELSERARARALLEGLQSTSSEPPETLRLASVQQQLAPDAAIVAFITVAGKTIAIVVRRDTAVRVELGSSASLHAQTVAFSSALSRQSGPSALESAATLHEAIVTPLRPALRGTGVVAWVADATLRGLPFFALYDRRRDRFVLEDVVSIEAPSASVAIEASRRTGVSREAAAVAVSGNGFSQELFPHLDRLPHTDRESETVAQLRPGSQRLAGNDATAANVRAAIQRFSIVHVASHAIDGRTPADAALVLAGRDRESSMLTARRIAEVPLHATRLAVLTACGSAAPTARGDGPESLAWAFLQAGVPAVVAAPRPVPDDVAAAFAIRFHRALLVDGDPGVALHNALRTSVRLAAGRPRSPAEWAGFTIIGGTSGLVIPGGERKE